MKKLVMNNSKRLLIALLIVTMLFNTHINGLAEQVPVQTRITEEIDQTGSTADQEQQQSQPEPEEVITIPEESGEGETEEEESGNGESEKPELAVPELEQQTSVRAADAAIYRSAVSENVLQLRASAETVITMPPPAPIDESEGLGYTYASNNLSFNEQAEGKVYEITGTASNRSITIEEGVSVTIFANNLVLTATGRSPVILRNGADLNLYLIGANTFAASSENYAGLNVPAGSSVMIDEGEEEAGLTARGRPHGAGIGGSAGQSGGRIEIRGGDIYAYTAIGNHGTGQGDNGAGFGSGIGGGDRGNSGEIIISGGTVKAQGGYRFQSGYMSAGAGIGGGGRGGHAESITITGGIIQTYSWVWAAGIGGGQSGNGGDIYISGGEIDILMDSNGATNGSPAGIGSGSGGRGGTIQIDGGTININAKTQEGSVGIGSASEAGEINITGGNITILCKLNGIGGGLSQEGSGINITGGKIEITGQGGGIGIGDSINAVTTEDILINGNPEIIISNTSFGIASNGKLQGKIEISDTVKKLHIAAKAGTCIGARQVDEEGLIDLAFIKDQDIVLIGAGNTNANCGAVIGAYTHFDGSIDFRNTDYISVINEGRGPGIGSGQGGTYSDKANIYFNPNMEIYTETRFGAGIGGGYNGIFAGNLDVKVRKIIGKTISGACIGGSAGCSFTGKMTIDVPEMELDMGAGVGIGSAGAFSGQLELNVPKLPITGTSGAGIGSLGAFSDEGEIEINIPELTITGTSGVGIGSAAAFSGTIDVNVSEMNITVTTGVGIGSKGRYHQEGNILLGNRRAGQQEQDQITIDVTTGVGIGTQEIFYGKLCIADPVLLNICATAGTTGVGIGSNRADDNYFRGTIEISGKKTEVIINNANNGLFAVGIGSTSNLGLAGDPASITIADGAIVDITAGTGPGIGSAKYIGADSEIRIEDAGAVKVETSSGTGIGTNGALYGAIYMNTGKSSADTDTADIMVTSKAAATKAGIGSAGAIAASGGVYMDGDIKVISRIYPAAAGSSNTAVGCAGTLSGAVVIGGTADVEALNGEFNNNGGRAGSGTAIGGIALGVNTGKIEIAEQAAVSAVNYGSGAGIGTNGAMNAAAAIIIGDSAVIREAVVYGTGLNVGIGCVGNMASGAHLVIRDQAEIEKIVCGLNNTGRGVTIGATGALNGTIAIGGNLKLPATLTGNGAYPVIGGDTVGATGQIFLGDYAVRYDHAADVKQILGISTEADEEEDGWEDVKGRISLSLFGASKDNAGTAITRGASALGSGASGIMSGQIVINGGARIQAFGGGSNTGGAGIGSGDQGNASAGSVRIIGGAEVTAAGGVNGGDAIGSGQSIAAASAGTKVYIEEGTIVRAFTASSGTAGRPAVNNVGQVQEEKAAALINAHFVSGIPDERADMVITAVDKHMQKEQIEDIRLDTPELRGHLTKGYAGFAYTVPSSHIDICDEHIEQYKAFVDNEFIGFAISRDAALDRRDIPVTQSPIEATPMVLESCIVQGEVWLEQNTPDGIWKSPEKKLDDIIVRLLEPVNPEADPEDMEFEYRGRYTKTNSSGAYSFKVEDGSYQVEFTKVNYYGYTLRIPQSERNGAATVLYNDADAYGRSTSVTVISDQVVDQSQAVVNGGYLIPDVSGIELTKTVRDPDFTGANEDGNMEDDEDPEPEFKNNITISDIDQILTYRISLRLPDLSNETQPREQLQGWHTIDIQDILPAHLQMAHNDTERDVRIYVGEITENSDPVSIGQISYANRTVTCTLGTADDLPSLAGELITMEVDAVILSGSSLPGSRLRIRRG